MNFTYSNVMECEKKFVVVNTNLGSNFTSITKNNNILDIQAHPEKSGKVGKFFAKLLWLTNKINYVYQDIRY